MAGRTIDIIVLDPNSDVDINQRIEFKVLRDQIRRDLKAIIISNKEIFEFPTFPESPREDYPPSPELPPFEIPAPDPIPGPFPKRSIGDPTGCGRPGIGCEILENVADQGGGGLPIITNLNPDQVRSSFGYSFTPLRGGVANVARLFGDANEGRDFYIGISDSNTKNAYFNAHHPGRIVVTDEILKDGYGNNTQVCFVAQHEMFHAMDYQYGLSRREFHSYWQFLKDSNSSFLHEINEKNFIPGVNLGGHAQDNPKEFLASFCNSLLREDWESAMRGATPEFCNNYRQTLIALRTNLENSDVPQDAPIRTLVNSRLDFFARSGIGEPSFEYIRLLRSIK